MSVRSRLANAPWPVWSLIGVLFWIAVGWPFLLVRSGYWVHVLIWGAVGLPVGMAITRRRNRRETGWDDARRQGLIRAARDGSAPADPEDRRRLREIVAKQVAEAPALRWGGAVLGGFCFAAMLLVFFSQDRSVGWLVAGGIWYAVLAAACWRLVRTMEPEQRQVLALLADPEDPEGPAEAAERPAEKPAKKPAKTAEKPAETAERPGKKPAETAERPGKKPARTAEKPAGKAGRPADGTAKKAGRREPVRTSRGAGSQPVVARAEVRAAAREVVGTDEFRPGQAEAIEAVLERDTLAVLASGTGKTLIYTIAAKLIDGGTLVVSPTIALQHDQLRALGRAGEKAALLNATLGVKQRRQALADFTAGELEFLLLAPEQLANDEVLAELKKAPISLIVIDEAHCLSDWGHDFRPDYLALGSVARALGSPRLLALTATASPRVREEIVRRLRMRDPEVVVRDADRPNIWLGVDLVGSENAKRDELLRQVLLALHGEPDHEEVADKPVYEAGRLPTGSGGVAPGGPGIVYAATHKRTEELAALLRDNGVDAVHYHGGLSRTDREAAQDAFMTGKVEVIVATSAFGMGVDKPDVRFVFHTEPPDSLDAYYQEIGRAGRDREPARAALFYLPSDLSLPRFFAGGGGPSVPELTGVLETVRAEGPLARKTLAETTGLSTTRITAIVNELEAAGAVRCGADRRVSATRARRDVSAAELAMAAADRRELHRQYAKSAVEMVRTYADTTDCRRRIVLELLGESHPERCGHCDNCDRGESVDSDDRPFATGQRVKHPEWGEGSVQTYEEGDRIVVLFDTAGYKTLALDVVADHDLLKPA